LNDLAGAEPPLADDPEIDDEDALWRRIAPHQLSGCPGANCRPSSDAFDDDDDGPLSVEIERLTSVEVMLSDHEGYLIAAISAGIARGEGLSIVMDPLEGHPGHALVIGAKGNNRRRRLAKASWWIVPPA
jgi:hypothetical protein